MNGRPEIIETPAFTRRRNKRLLDTAYEGFRSYIAEAPDTGDVMPRTSGWRKVRWAEVGQGKSGGVRIIYLYRSASGRIYLANIYAKSDKVMLTRAEEKALARLKNALD